MKFISKLFVASLTVLIALFLFSCKNSGRNRGVIKITCSAENRTPNKKTFVAKNDSLHLFSGGVRQTDLEAHSGNYSAMTSKKNHYVFSVTLKNIGPDAFFKASVWRKSKNNIGRLVVADTTAVRLYEVTDKPVQKGKNGWEKLELEFFTPPNFLNEKIKIYCWNNTNDTAFFDDITIVETQKVHPAFKEEPIVIIVDSSGVEKFINKRVEAFNDGVLQSGDNDWVKGMFFGDGNVMKVKLRLKGDWLDHLIGEKWSFRIKVRKDKTWNRLKTFSVQNPMTRFGAAEWFIHQVYNSVGVLSPRYGFVPVTFNMKNLGIYAWEEHFEKQLVEFHRYREGPVLKFYEDANWDVNRYYFIKDRHVTTAFFDAAVIKPFGASKVLSSPVSYRQFLIGSNLLFQYKYRLKPVSEVFNIVALAKYYALSDVMLTRHGTIWHNMRFYYNPVLCKLEPIAFDCYTETGCLDWVGRPIYGMIKSDEGGDHHDEYLMSRTLFNDFDFLKLYVHYLKVYSKNSFLQEITHNYGREAVAYDSLIKIEYSEAKFDTAYLFDNAKKVRQLLPDFEKYVEQRISTGQKWKNKTISESYDTVLEPYFFKHLAYAYVQERKADSVKLRVVNLFPEKINIIGTGKAAGKIDRQFEPRVIVKAYQGNRNNFQDVWVSDVGEYIFATSKNNGVTALSVYQWPQPDGKESPWQIIKRTSVFPDTALIAKVSGDTLYVRQGKIELDHKVLIPKGYCLFVRKGTTIDMVHTASVISYSPVVMEGSNEQPVIINSSDHSANGFAVLQATGRSRLNNVEFRNMNTLSFKGWTLTGAVTFYESDVDIANTKFIDNQCEDALNIVRSDFILKNSSFKGTWGDAFDSDFSTGLVDGVIFTEIGNDAIDFSGSEIEITNTTINGAQDKGISGGEDSHLKVSNTTISNANIGLASKDLSSLDVIDSKIDHCKYGLVLLQKKPEYGPATMNLKKVSISNTSTRFLIEKGSRVIFNRKIIEGDKKNVAKMFY